MLDCVAVAEFVEVGFEEAGVDALAFDEKSQSALQALPTVARCVNFPAVAGGEKGGFAESAALCQLSQGIFLSSGRYSELLADFYRCGPMVEPKGKNVHGNCDVGD